MESVCVYSERFISLSKKRENIFKRHENFVFKTANGYNKSQCSIYYIAHRRRRLVQPSLSLCPL